MARKEIQLGDLVKDVITGFEGIAIAETKWLTGCIRYGLRSRKLDNKSIPQEDQWFDKDQLKVIKQDAVSINIEAPAGPQIAPKINMVPNRGR